VYKKFPAPQPKITNLLHGLEPLLFITGKRRAAENVIHYGDQILIS
jgi:hypothetical protein